MSEDKTVQELEQWHLVDADPEDRYNVKAARYPGTVHHGRADGPLFFNGVVVPAPLLDATRKELEEARQANIDLTREFEQTVNHNDELQAELEECREALREIAELLQTGVPTEIRGAHRIIEQVLQQSSQSRETSQ